MQAARCRGRARLRRTSPIHYLGPVSGEERLEARALRLAAGLALSALLGLQAGCGPGESRPPPDRIILIVVDTLRRDHVSAYSDQFVSTPNIDRIAEKGQVFDNALSAFHATTMSMAALFAGHTPSIESGDRESALEWNTFALCGMSRFAAPGSSQCVPEEVDTLAEGLSGAGYYTMGVVSNRLLFRPYGYEQGFDDWIEVGDASLGVELTSFEAAQMAARTRTAFHVNTATARALARRKSDHFFLYVHYIDVHDWLLFDISYAESVVRFDAYLGQLLDLLEQRGLLAGATVILTSDHGEMLVEEKLHFRVTRHYGNPSFEPLLNVPLLIAPPTELDSDLLVRSQDVKGIVRRIAGLEGSPATDLEPDELFVTEQFYQTYRRGGWKSMWERKSDQVLLFDLEADPGEEKDLSGERPELLAEHRRRIDELAGALTSTDGGAPELGAEEIERLRQLGYLDRTAPSEAP